LERHSRECGMMLHGIITWISRYIIGGWMSHFLVTMLLDKKIHYLEFSSLTNPFALECIISIIKFFCIKCRSPFCSIQCKCSLQLQQWWLLFFMQIWVKQHVEQRC
jgi:hypothetical protein